MLRKGDLGVNLGDFLDDCLAFSCVLSITYKILGFHGIGIAFYQLLNANNQVSKGQTRLKAATQSHGSKAER
jgi:hypothetical protein